MEDIFDNLLYIIIASVAFIISSLGKKKKKNAQRTAPVINKTNENIKREEPFFANFFEEEPIEKEEGISVAQYKEQSSKKEEAKKEPVLDSVPSKKEILKSIEFEDTNDIISDAIKDSEIVNEGNEKNEILEDFDLKKAVIYSEILNRKVY